MDANAMRSAIAERSCEACGAGGVIAGLLASDGLQQLCTLLCKQNSGDVTGDRQSVVGYASAVITREPTQ